VVSVGQGVEVTILSVNPTERRIALSMDAANRDAEAREEKAAVQAHKGTAPKSLGTFADLLQGAAKKP
jgi:ribosomal protein S1